MTHDPCVLVLGERSLCDAVATAVRTNGYEAFECLTPLDAIQLLERHSPRIGYAVLSGAAPQALELCTLLADEYPRIQQLVLST